MHALLILIKYNQKIPMDMGDMACRVNIPEQLEMGRLLQNEEIKSCHSCK